MEVTLSHKSQRKVEWRWSELSLPAAWPWMKAGGKVARATAERCSFSRWEGWPDPVTVSRSLDPWGPFYIQHSKQSLERCQLPRKYVKTAKFTSIQYSVQPSTHTSLCVTTQLPVLVASARKSVNHPPVTAEQYNKWAVSGWGRPRPFKYDASPEITCASSKLSYSTTSQRISNVKYDDENYP